MGLEYQFLYVKKNRWQNGGPKMRCLVVSVREDGHEGSYITDSIYIPLEELKKELDNLDKNN